MTWRLTRRAEIDISEILDYVGSNDPAAADRLHLSLLAAFELAAEHPKLGVGRDWVRPGLRMIVAGNYLVMYRQAGTDVTIVRVLHGARRWWELV